MYIQKHLKIFLTLSHYMATSAKSPNEKIKSLFQSTSDKAEYKKMLNMKEENLFKNETDDKLDEIKKREILKIIEMFNLKSKNFELDKNVKKEVKGEEIKVERINIPKKVKSNDLEEMKFFNKLYKREKKVFLDKMKKYTKKDISFISNKKEAKIEFPKEKKTIKLPKEGEIFINKSFFFYALPILEQTKEDQKRLVFYNISNLIKKETKINAKEIEKVREFKDKNKYSIVIFSEKEKPIVIKYNLKKLEVKDFNKKNEEINKKIKEERKIKKEIEKPKKIDRKIKREKVKKEILIKKEELKTFKLETPKKTVLPIKEKVKIKPKIKKIKKKKAVASKGKSRKSSLKNKIKKIIKKILG